MSFEERIQKSVDAALAGLRTRVEEDVRSMVRELVEAAEQERNEAVQAAEQTARAEVEQLVERAREQERELVQEDAWRLAEAKAEQQVQEAIAASRQELEAALADAERRAQQAVRDSVIAARVGEREAEMAAVGRLLESVRGLDGATSLTEVLDALGLAAAREAARAAVLVLRNDRLHGWKLSGFGSRDSQPKSVDLALGESGVLAAAVSSARPMTTRDVQGAIEIPEFAELPADKMGLAVPVIVGGRVVAVVYADSVAHDGREQAVPSGWPEIIEILARHAARCLEALTVQKSAGSSVSSKVWAPGAAKGAAPQAEPSGVPQPGAGG
jgi:hypothetical protein